MKKITIIIDVDVTPLGGERRFGRTIYTIPPELHSDVEKLVNNKGISYRDSQSIKPLPIIAEIRPIHE